MLSVAPAGAIEFGPVLTGSESSTMVTFAIRAGTLTGNCIASDPYAVDDCNFDLGGGQSKSVTLAFTDGAR